MVFFLKRTQNTVFDRMGTVQGVRHHIQESVPTLLALIFSTYRGGVK